MALGHMIRARRQELGWTQDVLAQKAGISKGFLSDLENGKRGVRAETLLDIARVLTRSLDFLMTGEEVETNREEVEIPASLARFASEAGLSFRRTLTLLDVQRQFIAHRSRGDKEPLENIDWHQLYKAVKDYL